MSSPGVSTSNSNNGVYIYTGGYIAAGGTGNVTVTGTGGNTSVGSTGNSNTGVYIGSFAANGSGLYSTRISSDGGNVIINGYGGDNSGSGGSSSGVQNRGLIKAGGAGTVTVNGFGRNSASGSFNVGVAVESAVTVNSVVYPGTITSDGGNVTVNGQGGGIAGTSNGHYCQGINVGSGAIITAGSNGTVNVNGTGGNSSGLYNHGVYVTGSTGSTVSTITSGGGNINITCTEGGSSSSMAVALNSSAVVSTFVNGGDVTIKGNSLNIISSSVSVPATNTLNIIPLTPATNFNFTSTPDTKGTMNISATELGFMSGGTINIGNSNTGVFTLSQEITAPSGSNLNLATAASPGGLSPKVNGTEITMGSGKTLGLSGIPKLNINIAGTTVNTQYDQLLVAGDVTLTGLALSLTGAYAPVSGNVFTIVSAMSVTGTFTGLADGATISFNSTSLRINYTATEVTLTYAPCTNPTSGGAIAGAQSGSSPFDPVAFTSTTPATGHSGVLEYKWQESVTSAIAGFTDIASSNAVTYDPGSLTETTYYKRLARVSCKSNWTGAAESNVLQVTVGSYFGGTLGSSASVCSGITTTTLTLSGYTGTIVKWQSSTDNWATTSDINLTTTTLLATGLPATTKFRVVVQNAGLLNNSNDVTVTP